MSRGKAGCVASVAHPQASSIPAIANSLGINVNGRKIKAALDFACLRKDVKPAFTSLQWSHLQRESTMKKGGGALGNLPLT